jgi:hypothetical protein
MNIHKYCLLRVAEWFKWYSACLTSAKPSVQSSVTKFKKGKEGKQGGREGGKE